MNSIHPSAMILGDVRLGEGNTIGPLAVLIGPLVIGDANWIGVGTILGAPPEVRDWPHPRDAGDLSSGGGITLGSGNVLREYVQVHQGWRGVTTIGDDSFIMNQTYVAHDCTIEDGVTLASSVLLAGHVHVGTRANIGLGSSVHQGRYVGDGAMVGMASVVTRDIPPFSKAYGSPARVRGANTVGMERSGIPSSAIEAVTKAYDDASDLDHLEGVEGVEVALRHWRQFGAGGAD
jgi:UDP-N-acetylglucosamine acyltransferase